MHDNQLYEDVQAKHAFLMQNAAEWRRTRNVSVRPRPGTYTVGRLHPALAALINLITK